MADQSFEPVIIGFTCNWCSYRAADLAGTARVKYPPNIRLVRLMCSGRLDPTFVIKAFANGADGVLITGCHPGDCHYIEQNYKALGDFCCYAGLLTQMGIEPERVQLVWASAAEGSSWPRKLLHSSKKSALLDRSTGQTGSEEMAASYRQQLEITEMEVTA